MPPDTPQLVTAGPDDHRRVRDLVRRAYARWVPVIGREPRPMQADYARAVVDHRIDLLEGEGGALIALIETDLRSDHLWIENIAVHPDHQGRGVGSRLIAHAARLARAAGRRELQLLTNAAFLDNVRLYERLGFVTWKTEPWLESTTLYMRRSLEDPPG